MLAAFYGVVVIVRMFYTQNATLGIGVQGLSWLILPTPLTFYKIAFASIDNGGYPALRILDNGLFFACLSDGAFALYQLV